MLRRFDEALTIRAYTRKIKPVETALAKTLATLFRKQGVAFVRAFQDHTSELRESDTPYDTLSTIDIGAVAKAIGKSYVLGATTTGQEFALGVKFNLKNPRAVEYFNQRGLDLLNELNDTTRSDIHDLISEGLEAGYNYAKIAQQIRSQFVDYSARRAKTVAVTEAARAFQAGNYGAVLDATGTGLEFEKSWLAEGNACPICAANADDDWIAFGSAFNSGDDYPPAHPNCRCANLYRRLTNDSDTELLDTPTDNIDIPAFPLGYTFDIGAIDPRLDAVKALTTFKIGDKKTVLATEKALDKLFPNNKSVWSGKLSYPTMNAAAAYNPHSGDIKINPLLLVQKDPMWRDTSVRGIIHELIHARSEGIFDVKKAGLGWEEAIVEGLAQQYGYGIAHKLGYATRSVEDFTADYVNMPYYKRWIAPLNAVLDDLKIDHGTYYADMLGKTSTYRSKYVKDALIAQYGEDIGMTRFNVLNAIMQ